MPFAQSILSLSASGLYFCVIVACLAATLTAQRARQLPRHVWHWLLLALFFAVLIALRLLNVEDSLRNALRAALRAEDSYQERREIQGPIIATIVLLAGAGTLALHYRTMRYVRGRRNVARMAALWGAMAMLCLIGLRIISLHSVDALLYGAAKLNWIIDIGASLTVLGAAIYYTWLVRRQG